MEDDLQVKTMTTSRNKGQGRSEMNTIQRLEKLNFMIWLKCQITFIFTLPPMKYQVSIHPKTWYLLRWKDYCCYGFMMNFRSPKYFWVKGLEVLHWCIYYIKINRTLHVHCHLEILNFSSSVEKYFMSEGSMIVVGMWLWRPVFYGFKYIAFKKLQECKQYQWSWKCVYFEVNSVSETLVATIAMIAEVLFIAMQITVLYPLINRSWIAPKP